MLFGSVAVVVLLILAKSIIKGSNQNSTIVFFDPSLLVRPCWKTRFRCARDDNQRCSFAQGSGTGCALAIMFAA